MTKLWSLGQRLCQRLFSFCSVGWVTFTSYDRENIFPTKRPQTTPSPNGTFWSSFVPSSSFLPVLLDGNFFIGLAVISILLGLLYVAYILLSETKDRSLVKSRNVILCIILKVVLVIILMYICTHSTFSFLLSCGILLIISIFYAIFQVSLYNLQSKTPFNIMCCHLVILQINKHM